ncbi:MAG: group III truncated hemoglobin [Saprospiraceae bacterium]|nr:group III truncated hemoglobin [Saprospiraceae bacterium]
MDQSDIKGRSDIEFLIRDFYDHLLAIPTFAHVFLEVAEIQIEEHLEVLIDFWESVLFGTGKYRRNAMLIHMNLHMQHPLEPELFEGWLQQFGEAVDRNFDGQNAKNIKVRARSIAAMMQLKIRNLDQDHLELGG